MVKSKKGKVSIVVPAYNEEKHITNTLHKLKKFGHDIIVVDDGSIDRTGEISKKYARVVRHESNRGKGAAMRTGAQAARGDILVFIDASQFDPSAIPRFIEKMKHADMVVGWRDFSDVPPHRRVTNALTKLALWLATWQSIKDPISGFRAIRRDDFLALPLKENRYAIESEINYHALRRGMKMDYVPVKATYKDMPTSLNTKQNLILTWFLIKAVFRAV
jgi:glycosyltransferase involved in cell wall biosynthesis